MRVLLMVNTYATNYDLHRRRAVEAALGGHHDLEVAETHRHGHGLPIAQGALNRGVDAVVAWGGDGTINEVANALAGSDVGLGIIPGGSTNVTARTLGLPNDVSQATGLLLEALAEGRTRRIGLGRAGERYFTFASGIGFDAAVVREVEARSMMKRAIGPSVYIAAALALGRHGYDVNRPIVRFHYDDGTTSPDLVFAIVANSTPYTFFGARPMTVTPRASYERPLEILGLSRLPYVRSIGIAVAAFFAPELVDVARYAHRHRFVDAQAEGLPSFELHVDGEHRGERDRLAFRYEPDCLTVFV